MCHRKSVCYSKCNIETRLALQNLETFLFSNFISQSISAKLLSLVFSQWNTYQSTCTHQCGKEHLSMQSFLTGEMSENLNY